MHSLYKRLESVLASDKLFIFIWLLAIPLAIVAYTPNFLVGAYVPIDVLDEKYYITTDFYEQCNIPLSELELPENKDKYMLYLFACADDALSAKLAPYDEEPKALNVYVVDMSTIGEQPVHSLTPVQHVTKSNIFHNLDVVLSTSAHKVEVLDNKCIVLSEGTLLRLCTRYEPSKLEKINSLLTGKSIPTRSDKMLE